MVPMYILKVRPTSLVAQTDKAYPGFVAWGEKLGESLLPWVGC